jgi:colanic acid/amylovoran biosynthesis glycosyltransferase
MSLINICIISESANNPAETFIEAHRKYLKGNVHFLYGGTLPKYDHNNFSIAVNPSSSKRIFSKIIPGCAFSPLKEGVKRYLKKHKINVVLAEYGTTGAQIFSLCKELNIPMIVHFHGYDISIKEVIGYHKELYKSMFAYVSYIVAVSEDMRVDLIAAGASKKKIIVNPCGPDERFNKITPNYKSNNLLAIGRLTDKKAPYYTILAFEKLSILYPDLKLIMIGDGYLFNVCNNLVSHLKLKNKVKILSKVPHAEIEYYMNDSFCFVQHSIVAENGDSEGTPVSILEASAAGLPVVSTSHKGIKQAVIHEETGFLVQEHDVESMYKYMKIITENRLLGIKLGTSGRKHIQLNYSIVKHIKILDDLIANLI